MITSNSSICTMHYDSFHVAGCVMILLIISIVTEGMVAVLAVLEVLAVVPINVLSTSQLSAAAKHWSGT